MLSLRNMMSSIGTKIQALRKFPRKHKQCLFLFVAIVCVIMTGQVSREPREIVFTFPEYPTQLIRAMEETAQDFPRLRSNMERIGPDIDPRTQELRMRTSYELINHRTCNKRDLFFDKFITHSSNTLVRRHQYINEIGKIRVVIETSLITSDMSDYSITLLTHFTSDNTDALGNILDRWEGPVIAVVYTNFDVLAPKHKQLCSWLNNVGRQNVKLFLVVKSGMLYPINWLRNLAISRATTKYIFTVDGHTVPSVKLYQTLTNHLQNLETRGLKKTALLVPAFDFLRSDLNVPETRDDLLHSHKLGIVDGFHRDSYETSQNGTGYHIWSKANGPYFLANEKPCNNPLDGYFVMERTQSPYFPETPLKRGKNKLSYQYELCTNGYQYLVAHDGFVIRQYKSPLPSSFAKVDYCVRMAWKVFKDYVKTHPMLFS